MNKNKRKLIIYLFGIAILTLTVAYSALSTGLSMNGTAHFSTNGVWDIMFTNLGSPNLVGKAHSKNASLTATSIAFEASLAVPGDSISYTFDVVNNGILNAKISSITLLNEAYVSSQHISYLLTYENGGIIRINDVLEAGQTRSLKLTVNYDDVSSIPPSDITLSLGATLVYSQISNN